MKDVLEKSMTAARSVWVWRSVLALVSFGLAAFVVRANVPGRANIDIAHSARQALGEIPYDDWHPPAMAALWEALLSITGEISSMLYLQIILIFAASWLFSVLVHEWTNSRWFSVFAACLPMFPHVLSQAGMLWKDTQMAAALFLGAMLLLVAWQYPKFRYPLVIGALVLFLYGTLVRKNAAFAVVPLIVLAAYLLIKGTRLEAKLRTWPRAALASFGAVAVFGVIVVASGAVINAAYDVKPTSQVSQIMLDDVIFTVPADDIRAAPVSEELKDKLLTARETCRENGDIWDAYWNCYGRGETGKPFSPIEHIDEVQTLWLTEVITNPLAYLEYRSATFMKYLTSTSLEYWPIEWRVEAETVGLGPDHPQADSIQADYVMGFGVEGVPWLFKAWFWLAVSVAGLVYARRRATTLRVPIVVLALSALFYIVGYFPIVPSDHFRYTYWPAIAGTLVLIAMAADAYVRSARRKGPRADRINLQHSQT